MTDSSEILEAIDTDAALNDLETDFLTYLQQHTIPAVSDDVLARLAGYTHEVRVPAAEIALATVRESAADNDRPTLA